MNELDPTWIGYTALSLGGLALLSAAYQLIKRGFLLWLLVALFGLVAVNFGLAYSGPPEFLADWLPNLDASAIGELSAQQVERLCRQAGF